MARPSASTSAATTTASRPSHSPVKNPSTSATSNPHVASLLSKLSPEEYRSVMAAAAAGAMLPSSNQSTTSGEGGNTGDADASIDHDAEEVDEIAGNSESGAGVASTHANGSSGDHADAQETTAAASSERDDSQTAAAAMAAMSAIQAQQQNQQEQLNGPSQPFSSTPGGLLNFRTPTTSRSKRGPENERERKDQHKEVERRRRMHINEGLSRLSQMLPNCDSKGLPKGAVILAAIDYIEDLKNNEASNIEKWTLEKLLMDQHSVDLETRLEASKRECETLRRKLSEAQALLAEHEGGSADVDNTVARKRSRA